ncbi:MULTISPECIES: hypothetical protein [Burkholderia]|uniref:hypothetical protein n=1 Tax=Burkholderia TaxID=32008 RepID=UPI001E303D44|nr:MULTISPECIES: hypothetical protein [unclassified Burkholderia]UEP31824.1 hypothetical protein LMA01_21740 [Burkholderia sp. B21-007]UEP45587.1 hypothetical protein LMA02_23035 [Burkholderia sp. B21-005]
MALHDLLRLVGAAARRVGTVALVAVQAGWGVATFVKRASPRIGGTTMQSWQDGNVGQPREAHGFVFLDVEYGQPDA